MRAGRSSGHWLHVADKEMLKDVYVVTESCRSAFDLLHEYLPVFLARHMELSASAYDKDGVAASWHCIGVGADWVDLLAEVNPVYRQGKLFVSDMVHGKIVSADQVGDLLLYIFRFSKLSTTRWCSVGKSCRSLFAAVSVGLLPLALLALQLKGSLDTKLHGVKKLNDDSKSCRSPRGAGRSRPARARLCVPHREVCVAAPGLCGQWGCCGRASSEMHVSKHAT